MKCASGVVLIIFVCTLIVTASPYKALYENVDKHICEWLQEKILSL
jgi:hypothetical protein